VGEFHEPFSWQFPYHDAESDKSPTLGQGQELEVGILDSRLDFKKLRRREGLKALQTITSKKQNRKRRVVIRSTPLSFFLNFTAQNKPTLFWIGNALAGFIFGFSISFGLGLRTLASLVVGLIVATGVVIARSLMGFLLTQTASLTLLSVITYAFFRVFPVVLIPIEYVQILYLVALASSPLLSLFPKIRTGFAQLGGQPSVQFVSVLIFSGLIQILRFNRPSDAPYAFSQMYSLEDNAGVVGILGASLQNGYGAHAHMFGEFFNGLYLAAAGNITWFSNHSDLTLLAVLTHWNFTSLLMAWAPIAAFAALIFSGIKIRPLPAVVVILVMTSLLVLLIWPFSGIGHTSVISSGLVALSLLALTANRQLATSHPMLYGALFTALGFVVGITWFPLMPFSAAIVGITYIGLLRQQYLAGKRKTTVIIAVSLTLLLVTLLPSIWGLVSYSGTYLQMSGGTRTATDALVIGWLFLAAIVLWRLSKKLKGAALVGPKLFMISFSLLIGSNIYLLLQGTIGNSGSPGYGATKYLLTSIAFSTAVLFMLAVESNKKHSWLAAAAVGLVSILAVLIVQPDSRTVGTSLLRPTAPVSIETANSGVVLAISEALKKNPDMIVCASDFGYPVPDAEVRMESYFCSRWGLALSGASKGGEWRLVPINAMPIESLIEVRESTKDDKVVLLRFIDPAVPLLKVDTWWSTYVNESWEIIQVP
jgi:hypothetical protein